MDPYWLFLHPGPLRYSAVPGPQEVAKGFRKEPGLRPGFARGLFPLPCCSRPLRPSGSVGAGPTGKPAGEVLPTGYQPKAVIQLQSAEFRVRTGTSQDAR